MASNTNNQSRTSRLQRLRCSVQNYDWGRVGHESAAAKLFEKNSGLQIDGSKCYAELWMGTHPSGPSFVVKEEELLGHDNKDASLKSWIERNPGVLGDKVFDKWNTNLPFLFKVYLYVLGFCFCVLIFFYIMVSGLIKSRKFDN